MNWHENKTILTPTSGFLKTGYTHSVNVYRGCAFAKALCGTFCYAQHNIWITKGRRWGFYAAKRHVADAYCREYDRIKKPSGRPAKPLKIYMSSVTDPYIPQEARLKSTRALLTEMVARPPDALVVQTHNTLILRDIDLIQEIAEKCTVWVSMSVETDMDPVPGLPQHASPPQTRLAVAKQFKDAGVKTQIAVSPLLPISDLPAFCTRIDECASRVILDHFLIGDGSPNGLRTKRTGLIPLLESNGFGEWSSLEKLWEVSDYMTSRLGKARVLVSCEGFNSWGFIE
ncbi:MAG: radical SAM protein [bacterium]